MEKGLMECVECANGARGALVCVERASWTGDLATMREGLELAARRVAEALAALEASRSAE